MSALVTDTLPPVASGPIYQICWVVEDLDRAEGLFTEAFGVPTWTRWPEVHFGPPRCTLRGEPADYVIDISIGYAGAQQVELIAPVRGTSLYAEHLARSGPGLHHVAYLVDDMERAVAVASARGLSISQRGAFEEAIEFVYLDASSAGAPHIELMSLSPDMRGYFDSLAGEAASLVAGR